MVHNRTNIIEDGEYKHNGLGIILHTTMDFFGITTFKKIIADDPSEEMDLTKRKELLDIKYYSIW